MALATEGKHSTSPLVWRWEKVKAKRNTFGGRELIILLHPFVSLILPEPVNSGQRYFLLHARTSSKRWTPSERSQGMGKWKVWGCGGGGGGGYMVTSSALLCLMEM